MVDSTNLAYSYSGDLENLIAGVRKSCEKMSLVIKDESITNEGFSFLASQKTNWLSTNWPVKFNVTVEKIDDKYALLLNGSSSMGSLTQSANNHAKAQELLSLIKVYSPSK
jgi:hypothetical protein